MATAGERWAFWLETQLEDKGWRAADLVKASGLKRNGRPVIDAPRVSAWLKGERPSFELAVLAGNVLGGKGGDALVAAGYPIPIGEVETIYEDGSRVSKEYYEIRPVGLGLDDEAADLAPEQIESVRAVIRAMKPKADK